MGGVWRGAAERDRAGDAASDAPASGSRAFRVCTYLARGLDPCDTGVLLSDYFDENDDRSGSVSSGASSRSPMFELIARVFAPVRGVERVADVGARLCATCYRRLIVAIDPIDNFEIP